MEKVIRRQLFDFLRQNNILSDKQYGFLSGRSTTIQLLKALDDWTAELDKGYEVDIVYIDLQKAFDSVPRKKTIEHNIQIWDQGENFKLDPSILNG